ncbi:MAG TPA: hypothetical protein VMU29_02605 [Smithella sp.]|nr:hypothetical protein [Smithella sp.]
MKMFALIYADYFDRRVTNEFKQAEFKQYTKVHGTTGEGKETGAKLGTSNSPFNNNILYIAVPDEEIPKLLEIVRSLRRDYPNEGFRAFTYQLEECI